MTNEQTTIAIWMGGIALGVLIIIVKVWIILYIAKKIIGWIKNK